MLLKEGNGIMSISCIIPTFNRSALLKNTIKTLINQTISPDIYEIIVVDNGSVDDTKEIVQNINEGDGQPSNSLHI
jgi:glycosyltransferase involved in cell wall biosynthesis